MSEEKIKEIIKLLEALTLRVQITNEKLSNIERSLESKVPHEEYKPKYETIQEDNKTKTIEKKTIASIDVRDCIDYSLGSWKLISFDNKHCWVAKQHVKDREFIEGNGIRIHFTEQASNWVPNKLEWTGG